MNTGNNDRYRRECNMLFSTHDVHEFMLLLQEVILFPLYFVKIALLPMIRDFFKFTLQFVKQKWIDLICFIILLFVGVVIYICDGEIYPSHSMLAAFVGIMASIIGVSLPIVISNITEKLNRFHSNLIKNAFKKEKWYMLMQLNIFVLCVTALLFILLKDSQCTLNTISIVICVWFLFATSWSLFTYWKFIKLCIDYTLHTNKKILEKCEDAISSYEGRGDEVSLLSDSMEVAARTIILDLDDDLNTSSKNTLDICNRIFLKGVTLTNYKDAEERMQMLYSFVSRIYDIYFQLWRKCYKTHSGICNEIVEKYQNVVEKVIGQGLGMNSINILSFFYQRVSATLTPEEAKTLPGCASLPFRWYFDYVCPDNVDIDTPVAQQLKYNLFLAMRNAIDRHNRVVFHAYMNLMNNELWLMATDTIITYGQEEIKKRQDKYVIFQKLSLYIAAYALFADEREMVNDYLYFNSPTDSTAVFVNRDICPDNVQQIVDFYQQMPYEYGEWIMLWPDHHDHTLWVKKMLVLIFMRYFMRHDMYASKDSYVIPSNLNKQGLEALSHSIEQFKNIVSSISVDELTAFSLNSDLEQNAINCLKQIEKKIYDKIETITKDYELDEQKVKQYQHNFASMVNENSTWMHVLSNCSLTNENVDDKKSPLKLYLYLPKEYFAKGDSGLFFGFEQAPANHLLEMIDNTVEQLMRAKARTSTAYGNIRKENLFQDISSLTGNDIVVFVNYMRLLDHFIMDKSFQWIHGQGELVGITANGTNIFSTFDKYDSTSKVYIFNAGDISPLSISLEEKNIKIIDLNENEDERKKQIDKDATLASQIPEGEKRDEYLKTQTMVRVNGEFSLTVANNIRVRIWENI